MADEVTICNLALARIGAARIVTMADATQSARYCTLFFESTRDEVLRAHEWNFAKARVALTKDGTAPVFGWEASFALPADFLRLVQVNGWEADERRDEWEIEGQKLLTDTDTADVTYIKKVTDENLFDPLFVEALVLKLAAKLALPLSSSRTLAGEMLKEYESLAVPKANKADANERRAKRKPAWVESDLVNARWH